MADCIEWIQSAGAGLPLKIGFGSSGPDDESSETNCLERTRSLVHYSKIKLQISTSATNLNGNERLWDGIVRTSFWQVPLLILVFSLVCLNPQFVFAQSNNLRNDAKWHVGCELFQMLLEERGMTQLQSLEASLESPKTSVIVLAGDLRRLRVDIWARIVQFVKRGGNILIASDQGRSMSGIAEIKPGPVVSLEEADQFLNFKDCIRIQNLDQSQPVILGVNEIVSNRTAWLILPSNTNTTDLFHWKTIAALPEHCYPIESSRQPIIALGTTNSKNSGVIAIVADTSILSNGMLWHGDNATFAIRISELLATGQRSGLSFVVDGRVLGSYKERLQPPEPPPVTNMNEASQTPATREIPETDLETKLRMANHVLKSVAESNILNEALANQPRPMNARFYTFVVLTILASLAALMGFGLSVAASPVFPRASTRHPACFCTTNGLGGFESKFAVWTGCIYTGSRVL